jgi:hypothetical protein
MKFDDVQVGMTVYTLSYGRIQAYTVTRKTAKQVKLKPNDGIYRSEKAAHQSQIEFSYYASIRDVLTRQLDEVKRGIERKQESLDRLIAECAEIEWQLAEVPE